MEFTLMSEYFKFINEIINSWKHHFSHWAKGIQCLHPDKEMMNEKLQRNKMRLLRPRRTL